MGDWGMVSLYYDYESKASRERRLSDTSSRRRGLISRAYKYFGEEVIMQRGLSGLDYFLQGIDSDCWLHGMEHHFVNGRNYSGWDELNEAFDVDWEDKIIYPGVDSVSSAFEACKDDDSDENIRKLLYACEGSYGWLHMSFTGNESAGYTLKYGYFLHDFEHGQKLFTPLIEKCFSESDIKLCPYGSEEEFWASELDGVNLIKELHEALVID